MDSVSSLCWHSHNIYQSLSRNSNVKLSMMRRINVERSTFIIININMVVRYKWHIRVKNTLTWPLTITLNVTCYRKWHFRSCLNIKQISVPYCGSFKMLSPCRNAHILYSDTVSLNQLSGLVRLWCHNCTVTTLSHAPSTAVAAKTLTELIWKHRGQCLLRPVTADQSEQSGL